MKGAAIYGRIVDRRRPDAATLCREQRSPACACLLTTAFHGFCRPGAPQIRLGSELVMADGPAFVNHR